MGLAGCGGVHAIKAWGLQRVDTIVDPNVCLALAQIGTLCPDVRR
jgi:hypothetical protein